MRRTQRAPRSCKECSSRKIKCDKAIPCKPCTNRGQASRCTREIVLVRGVVTVAEDKDRNRSMQALTEQNRRLRGMISSSDADPRSTPSKLNAHTISADDMINHPQKLMALVFPSQFISVVHTWNDICSPNRSQSFKLLEHGKLWTSWIHCAIYYPEFEAAHEDFWKFLELGGVVRQRNPSWLAIYYGLLAASLLTSDEGDIALTNLPHNDLQWLIRNWYSASLFCLEEANYLRENDLMNVQAIAILQMCSNAVGDIVFRNRMLAMGIQIANDVGIPFGADFHHSLLQAEYSRRLWWVFVICEWFTPVNHRPCISEDDFEVVLPLPFNDAELETGQVPAEISSDLISPWWYHRILCETALIYHQFIQALRKKETDLETLVRAGDEALANVIDSLPPHLQPYREETLHPHPDDKQYPWIRWQRVDLTTILLLCRAKINYECRRGWSASPPSSLARRMLCLESAKSVIMVLESAEMPIHQRRFMTYTLRLYSAGLILASEIPRSADSNESLSLMNNLLKCIHLLELSKDSNFVAEKAVEHLSTFALDLSTD